MKFYHGWLLVAVMVSSLAVGACAVHGQESVKPASQTEAKSKAHPVYDRDHHHAHTDDNEVAAVEKREKSVKNDETDPADNPDHEKKSGSQKQPAEPASNVIRDQAVTQHAVTIDGKKIEYTATAANMLLLDDNGKERARVFFTAYTREGIEDLGKRPITFAFNGGPGAASLWLHIGVLGPRRIQFDDFGNTDGPPYELEDNAHSILDFTDIVMIDPVSTGFSRPAEGQKASEFHGYQEDLNSVGEFIWSYVTHNKRWKSPKFLMGESYGTTRAAGLSGHLQSRYGMYINGVALLSVVLDFQTLRFGSDNDLAFVLFLPSYTATAWFHGKLDPALQGKQLEDVLEEARDFARSEYMPALFKGISLSPAERKTIIAKVARYTGLPERYVDHANLRISMNEFAKELMRDDNQTIGRFDGRYLGIDRVRTGTHPDYDPSLAALFGPFTTGINFYLREELNFHSNLSYDAFGNVGRWNFSQFTGRYVNVTETLRSAMTQNPRLKVYCGNGYYDLATPFFAAEHTMNHLGLAESLQKNVHMQYYESGHMFYVHKPSLIKFRDDMKKFYKDALNRQ